MVLRFNLAVVPVPIPVVGKVGEMKLITRVMADFEPGPTRRPAARNKQWSTLMGLPLPTT